MKIKSVLRYSIVTIAISFFAHGHSFATNYYVDSFHGNDDNSGNSPSKAWQSLTMINNMNFTAGDSILMKFGSIWNDQQLWPKGSGTIGRPIVVRAYGNPLKGKPVLNGNGEIRDVVYLYNQEWIEILDLEITNYGAGDLINDTASFKRGVYILGEDCGELNHLYLVNLYIHNVNGYGENINAGKYNGGIFFEIRGTSIPSWFNDFQIEGCHIYDVIRTGINNQSTWNDRSTNNWYPSLNVRIRNTIVEKAGFNAMIPRACQGLIVEHCTLINNGGLGNGNAIFQWSSDSNVYQYNEAYGTYFNPGDHDAAGFDGGGLNNNCIIQYNYSHDNGLGGIVIGLGPDLTNYGTKIRYNILQNNRRQAFRFSGPANNTEVYNNTIYIGPELSDVNILFHKRIKQSPDGTSYHNNIFYILAEDCYYTFGESTNYRFSHNLFFGKHPETEPDDPFKLTSDPLLIAPGTGGIGRNSVSGYKLFSQSPCIDSGISIDEKNGGLDFWGNRVPWNGIPDIGAHEWNKKP